MQTLHATRTRCVHTILARSQSTHGENENESEIENSNGLTSVPCMHVYRVHALECILYRNR